MVNRVAILIDGGYLDRVLKDEFQGTRIRFDALSKQLAGDSDILRTYYYYCPRYQENNPTIEESERYERQQSFFTKLGNLPRFTVRLGRLAYRVDGNLERPRFEQKMVDMYLGVDMVKLAVKQEIQEVILVAGDSDFIPAVQAAKQEGVLVRLCHGGNSSEDLRRECDERIQFSPQIVEAVRRE